ncbi:hypothetical protein O1611_g5571 [Lasiodiplodia mahajangana]|uniref:Uncharacterized protein n=1 Tax=Lasiodiplodia mahajangana TaxID=1108764 RepID=A0ACC2JLI9_9PEZI|nr:hypothetical protein O1611_g5571 [Lasiodiplodia mahajangana]
MAGYYGYDYDYDYDSDEIDHEFPRFPGEKIGFSWLCILIIAVLFFLAAVGGLITDLVLIIKFIKTDNTGFEPSHPKFELFKNSRFEECSYRVPDAANCTAILDIISHSTDALDQHYLSRGHIPVTSQWRGSHENEFDWCTTASCFNGYKVVASSVRPSVVGLTNFGIWSNVNVTAVVFLFTLLKRYWDIVFFRKYDVVCYGSFRDIGFMNGAVLIYTLGTSIIWWWINYAQFLRDPVPNTTLSIYAWTTAWLLASNLHYHPFSCFLGRVPCLKRMLQWLIALITVAQWGATIHVLVVGRRDFFPNPDIHQGYDCSETMIAEALGTAQCSSQMLCSDSALLANVPFSWGVSEQFITISSVAYFALISAFALQPFILTTLCFRRSWSSSWSEEFKRCDLGPIAGPAVAGIFGVVYSVLAARVGLRLLTLANREAPIVADPFCNAVHVGLSPWRYYLDLDINNRALRIARSYFNA